MRIFLALFFLLSSACTYEDESAVTVRITIPNDFFGVFAIAEDPEKGTDIHPREGIVDLSIANDGWIVVRDSDFLDDWFSLSISRENGTSIPHGFLDMPDGTVGYYSLWTDTKKTTYFLIGTDVQYERAQKKGRVEVGVIP